MIPGWRRTGKVRRAQVDEKSRPARVPCRWLPLLILLTGCGADEGRPLRVVSTVPVTDPASATLSLGPDGHHWVGAPGVLRMRSAQSPLVELPMPGDAPPRVQGWIDGAAYVRTGDTLSVVPRGADSAAYSRGGFGDAPVIADVRGRMLLQGAGSGAILAHHPDSLAPVWAWPALGRRTTALAASPEGDRLHQAVASEGGDATILTRDLQTGRQLSAVELPAPLDALAVDPAGTLYGMAREGRATVVALRPRQGDLQLLWRRTLPMADEAGQARLAVAAGRVAVWGLGGRVGLRLLDARTGEILARTSTDPTDAAFGPDGSLWALYPGEIRRLE